MLPRHHVLLLFFAWISVVLGSAKTRFFWNDGNYGNRYNPGKFDSQTYDYIVVGSGAAGSVVANRLTSNSNISVLLVETGDEPSFHSDVPFMAAVQQFNDQNWGYRMEKQENFGQGLLDERMRWPRGRVLGGTSVINFMLNVRGNKEDYDRWANAGNPGWSYDDVLPYFKKMEDASIEKADVGYHGKGGPVSIVDLPYHSEVTNTFIKACEESGYMYVDYNGRSQMGVSHVQSTLKDGKRCSAEKAYIRPVRDRKNLHTLLTARVTKVLLHENKTAYGVQFFSKGSFYTAYARREVVLSAGTFHSPQILMLSGIGPHDDLAELGIPLVQDLPVGKKLYDHLTFLGLAFTVNQPIVQTLSNTLSPSSLWNYLMHGKGPLTVAGGVQAFAYYKTTAANYTQNYPDMEFIFIGTGLQADYGTIHSRMFGVSPETYEAFWGRFEDKYAFSVYPMLLHPKSYGHLKLKSIDPLDSPLLYGNFFTDPARQDIRAFISAIREIQRITKSPHFKTYDTEQVTYPILGCEAHTYDSDEYWECALRAVSVTLHHQVHTCKMGPASDPEAVVDHELRVHGIRNLRVIDTSIIPVTLSAHTNTPAFMIGEKGADLLLEAYKSSQ